jgi:hypothetical protein
LANPGAQDGRSYDFIKDLSRLERVVTIRPKTRGAAILLTNDRSHWSESTKVGGVHAAFRLHEGRRLAGRLDWASHTGPGTKEGREQPLVLRGDYALHWRDYSDLDVGGGRFRYLLVPVE